MDNEITNNQILTELKSINLNLTKIVGLLSNTGNGTTGGTKKKSVKNSIKEEIGNLRMTALNKIHISQGN